MKKQFKYFLVFYLAFLLVGAACNSLIEDDCGPFPDKYNITNLNWQAPTVNSSVAYDDVKIDIAAVGTYFFSQRNTFDLFGNAYACSQFLPKPTIYY